MKTDDDAILADADSDAADAAAAIGVTVRGLRTPAEMDEATALISRIWMTEPNRALVDRGMLIALAHTGNYVAGVYRAGVLIAAGVGFFHPPEERTLHSHIAGVAPDAAGAGVGLALKLYQRAWSLHHGVDTVTWTFDPLVARNAYFNIVRLRATAAGYIPDFYGTMADGLNRGQPGDRMLVEWDLHAPRSGSDPALRTATGDEAVALAMIDGAPRIGLETVASASVCRVEIPADIEALRRTDPGVAAEWRLALREVLGELMAEGWSVTDFARGGSYRLERA